MKRTPDHPWVKPRLEALQARKTEEALEEARKAYAAADSDGAKKAFLRTLFYSPDSVEANLSLARMYRTEKNLQSALIYELVAEQDPKNKDIQDRIEGLKNRLGIYELPSLYNAIPASAAITREDLAAMIAVKFKSILIGADLTPPILVDIAVSWASKFILKVTALGIMDSFENHTFLPKKVVNRAELAEILVRLANTLKNKGYKFSQQIPPDRIQISDVPPDNYYHAPITQVVSYQIMDLTPQRTFQPDAVVSGKDAEKILDIVLALIK